ncbi:DNA topoisomerase 3 alpha [Carpediemonas membranifera]|uniref:DNA topoisomerase n=1 Tax=Carpediemonas membranifera TaxID=201153 RepID=A0A8J6AZS2_9EUKA|nr:DNA topoisomerase 3 alpha [Carpediemonas membranifera]|eukprot:KAG9391189.1 DNA topoisomerase 3 alpha [Carpediemonas membranifera]
MQFPQGTKDWNGVDPAVLFTCPVTKHITKDAAKIARQIEKEARRADHLVLWTDCDREGENIGAEIADTAGRANPRIDVHRARFNAVTGYDVTRALDNLDKLDTALAAAADVRSELDLRIGAAFTRHLTLSARRHMGMSAPKLLSYGPCQIPTLGLVIEAADRHDTFIPQSFWYLKLFATLPWGKVPFTWTRGRLFDQRAVEILHARTVDRPVLLERVEEAESKVVRPRPMDTIGLQTSMARRYRVPASTTMKVAESLYQRGLLSYPRTETTIFAQTIDLDRILSDISSTPEVARMAARLRELGRVSPRNDGRSDGAHPPIHPTGPATLPGGSVEQKLYDLVTRRFMACQAPDGVDSTMRLSATVGPERFHASFRSVKSKGWREFEGSGGNERGLPEASQVRGLRELPSTGVKLESGQTEPPPLLDEAGLIRAMNDRGIGTDATTAEHVNTIISRNYATRETSAIKPTPLGRGLISGLLGCGASAQALVKPTGRALTEMRMRRVAGGLERPGDVVRQTVDVHTAAWREVLGGTRAIVARMQEQMNA